MVAGVGKGECFNGKPHLPTVTEIGHIWPKIVSDMGIDLEQYRSVIGNSCASRCRPVTRKMRRGRVRGQILTMVAEVKIRREANQVNNEFLTQQT